MEYKLGEKVFVSEYSEYGKISICGIVVGFIEDRVIVESLVFGNRIKTIHDPNGKTINKIGN